ncbi:MAG: SgcJ/EcaC family oxidoreductase [Pseudonocardiaceae bacterium]
MTDDEQLTDLFQRMCQAWTEGDAQSYGDCFTEDSDYVSFDGTRAAGRAPMVEVHDRLFRGVLNGSSLVGQIESIRYLGADVALVHATGSVLVAWRSRLPKRRLSRQTLVATRTADGWLFAALQNTRVRPVRIPAPESFPARAARRMVRVAGALGLGKRPDALFTP